MERAKRDVPSVHETEITSLALSNLITVTFHLNARPKSHTKGGLFLKAEDGHTATVHLKIPVAIICVGPD